LRENHGIMLVFDSTSTESKNEVKGFNDIIREQVSIPTFLVDYSHLSPDQLDRE